MLAFSDQLLASAMHNTASSTRLGVPGYYRRQIEFTDDQYLYVRPVNRDFFIRTPFSSVPYANIHSIVDVEIEPDASKRLVVAHRNSLVCYDARSASVASIEGELLTGVVVKSPNGFGANHCVVHCVKLLPSIVVVPIVLFKGFFLDPTHLPSPGTLISFRHDASTTLKNMPLLGPDVFRAMYVSHIQGIQHIPLALTLSSSASSCLFLSVCCRSECSRDRNCLYRSRQPCGVDWGVCDDDDPRRTRLHPQPARSSPSVCLSCILSISSLVLNDTTAKQASI
jgi:hypothetical protein